MNAKQWYQREYMGEAPTSLLSLSSHFNSLTHTISSLKTMEQTGLKLRISRMFRSSFGSCRTRHISDVNETAVLAPQPPPPPVRHRRKSFNQDQPPMTSPKSRPLPSICKPRCPDSGQPDITHSYIRVSDEILRRRPKIHRHSPSGAGEKNKTRRKRTPFSGGTIKIEPFPSTNDGTDTLFPSDFYSGAGKKHKTRRKRTPFSNPTIKIEPFPSSDDGTDTLFSSRSLSSDSSKSRRRRTRKTPTRNCEVSLRVSAGKVKDSFAVVKSSSDPYGDFRASMVEMIVEKQIFGAADQEQLLQCFLSLNSRQHHRIIVRVFTEIREALFCNWC